MEVVRILVGAGYSLVFAQIHFGGKRPHDSEQVARPEFLFVLRGDADLEAQVFVPAPLIVAVQHFEFAYDFAGLPAS